MKYLNFPIHSVLMTIVPIPLLACSIKRTDVQLPKLFSDNMVLQQNSTNPIWGNATAGSELKITTSWGEKVSTTTTDDGKWITKINTPEANGNPQSITISARDTTIMLNNVLAGEVWLASGQSNMEMPVSGWLPRDSLLNSAQEIENADYPNIRMFTVKRNKSFYPVDTVSGSWKICNPENVPDFSATAYFYGRKLYEELNIPIGLIHSSWSGSPAQSWVEVDFVEKIEGYEDVKEEIANASDPSTPYNQWLTSMSKRPQTDFIGQEGFKSMFSDYESFMQTDYNDSTWDNVSANTMDKVFLENDFNGMIWFRQEFNFEGDENSEEYQIFWGKVDDLNTSFINGTLVGRTEHWGNGGKDQIYSIPANVLQKGRNLLAVRNIDVWDAGGLLSPPAIINKAGETIQQLNDTWKYLPVASLIDGDFYKLESGFNSIVKPEPGRIRFNAHTPTVLYNAMIAPLIPYSIKGAIWYQGESNIGKSAQYHTLFPAVFNSWRSNWGIGDFPFYYVQLASFNYRNNKVAELREAQLSTLKEKNVGMAVTMDIGDATTIHPPNKQDVGKRLALIALAKIYGKSDLVYSGPIYKGATFDHQKAVITFDHIGGGLYSPEDELTYFEIAGVDGEFHPAKAIIDGDNVLVKSNKVQNPRMVRFALDDVAMPNLFNKEGLPASPFRSVSWTPGNLYPPDTLIKAYHNEWTQNHYKERIAEFKNDPLNFGDLVFIGNSITEGGKDWGARFGTNKVKNRGIGGDVTDGVLARLEETIFSKPKAVFLLIGINDLFNIHYKKEIPSVEYVAYNVLKIVDIIAKNSPDTKIYLQTLLPTSKDFMSENISTVNAIIKSLEKDGKYKVIDLHSTFTDEKGLMKVQWTYDGTHLNDTGYKVWEDQVKQYIKP